MVAVALVFSKDHILESGFGFYVFAFSGVRNAVDIWANGHNTTIV